MMKSRQRRDRQRLQFFKPLRVEALEERAMLALTSQLVADLNPGPGGSFEHVSHIEVVNGVGYFFADKNYGGDIGLRQSLWKTDGTSAGTTLVSNLEKRYSTARPASVNGNLFFSAESHALGNGTLQEELWKSDGTAAGTVLLMSKSDSDGTASISLVGSLRNMLFFSVKDPISGQSLWRTDGTPAGTLLVQPTTGILNNGMSFQGRFFFVANDGVHGHELWTSDGTPAGTSRFSDINPGSARGIPTSHMTEQNGSLFFNGDGGAGSRGVWKTDGTVAGTVLVKEFGNDSLRQIMNVNGTLLFFSWNSGNSSLTPWRSDGTPSGTVALKSLRIPFSFLALENDAVNVNGTVFFAANDGVHGDELWKTDGTTAGTVMVKDINPTSRGADIFFLTNANGTLFFAADDGLAGAELWQSDGTAAGTVLVSDLNTGAGSSSPEDLRSVNGRLIFTANDGIRGRELWSVTLQANRVPVATSSTVNAAEDNAVAVSLNASDADNQLLSYSIVSPPAHGTLGGTAPNLTYTPDINYHGSDSFTFRASDGQANSNVATVAITITPVNDAPVAVNGSVTVPVNSATAATLAAIDAENNPLTFSVVNAPVRGTLSGTAPNLIYTPANNYAGPDSFTFRASDGQTDSNMATVAITVSVANTAPLASGQSVTTAEDTPKGITLAATDAESSQLTYTVVGSPLRGTLSGTAPNLIYVPSANYHGGDSFTFRASDGALDSNLATVAITVTPLNDPPVASDVSVATDEDTPKAVTLAASDVDNDRLTFSIVSQPLWGSLSGTIPNLIYTPFSNRNGNDSFTFRANDGTVDSAVSVVTISVTPVNDPPIAPDDLWATGKDVATNIRLLVTDADLDLLTYAILSPPQNGTLSGSGREVTYTPRLGFEGTDSFTYQVSDGRALSNIGTVSILVINLSVFAEDGPQNINNWGQTIFPQVPPGGSPNLDFQTGNSNPALFSAQPAIDSTGKLTFTPAPNSKGKATVSVLLQSSGTGAEGEEGGVLDTTTGTFTIEVLQLYPWQNDLNWLDVDFSLNIGPHDAVLIIDYLNGINDGIIPPEASPNPPYLDPSGNNFISPYDAILVINELNAEAARLTGSVAEGESDSLTMLAAAADPQLAGGALTRQSSLDDLIALLAFDLSGQTKRRRRL